MMLRILSFISSYAPLYIILLLEQPRATSFVLFMSILLAISVGSIYLVKNIMPGNYCEPRFVRPPLSSFGTYILPYSFVAFSLVVHILLHPVIATPMNDLFLVLILAYVFWDQKVVTYNPIWNLFGYRTYRYENGYILTDMPYEDLAGAHDFAIYGSYVNNDVFVAHKADN